MSKIKSPAKVTRSKKPKTAASEHEDVRERHTADKVMQTVLAESKAEEEVQRLDQWVSIECPHCGEATDLHVIADMDGQSIDQDCTVCCRPYIAHVEIDEGEAHVGVEGA
jgi:hypothetical protein